MLLPTAVAHGLLLEYEEMGKWMHKGIQLQEFVALLKEHGEQTQVVSNDAHLLVDAPISSLPLSVDCPGDLIVTNGMKQRQWEVMSRLGYLRL